MVERGHKLTEVAELTGLGTRQRVQRLIQVSTAVAQGSDARAVTDAREASRQFEERLAAVEATLDEVVSGVPTVNEAVLPLTDLGGDYELLMAKEPFVVETFGTGVYATVEPPVREGFDPLTADIGEVTGVLEPTQVMPALSAALHPTKDLGSDDSWYRRDDHSGAA